KSSGVEMLYGRLPTTLSVLGAGASAAKSNSSAFARCTTSRPLPSSSAARASASRGSISTTCNRPTRSTSGRVSAPWPPPISTTTSFGSGSIAATIFAITAGSCRKCWPKRLFAWIRVIAAMRRAARSRGRAACERERELDGRAEAVVPRAAGAGERERGAVVDRCPDDRQPERDVHDRAEIERLQRRQRLIVVHRDHDVAARERLGRERGVGRHRARDVEAGGREPPDHGLDQIAFLVTQHAALARVRVQAEHGDTRGRQTEARAELVVRNPN